MPPKSDANDSTPYALHTLLQARLCVSGWASTWSGGHTFTTLLIFQAEVPRCSINSFAAITQTQTRALSVVNTKALFIQRCPVESPARETKKSKPVAAE